MYKHGGFVLAWRPALPQLFVPSNPGVTEDKAEYKETEELTGILLLPCELTDGIPPCVLERAYQNEEPKDYAHPQHMEIPRLGVQLELQLPGCATATQQRKIRAASARFTTAHSNARFLTHWVGPGLEPASSRILVWFITAEPQQELLIIIWYCV